MADNYLGKKMEEYMARRDAGTAPRRGHSLAHLLTRNRSHRAYDPTFIVREDQLRRIIEVNTRTPSARNQQVLRFRAVLSDEAAKVLPKVAASIPFLPSSTAQLARRMTKALPALNTARLSRSTWQPARWNTAPTKPA